MSLPLRRSLWNQPEREKKREEAVKPLPPVEVCLAKSQEPAESFSLSLRTISCQMVSSMVM